mmetsp:Transcript_9947/g.12273  ORF Transcript_9947/g.12273 Transcript_9947/m.12273 type:complete len:180 (+) Transcript_9947:88-627(+)
MHPLLKIWPMQMRLALYLSFFVVLFDGELFSAISFFFQKGAFATWLIIGRTLTFFWAVHSYSAIIKEISAVSAVTIGILRKVLTIVFSMIFFRKPFARAYVGGGAFLALGLVAEARVGLRKKRKLLPSRSGGSSSKYHSSDPNLSVSDTAVLKSEQDDHLLLSITSPSAKSSTTPQSSD